MNPHPRYRTKKAIANIFGGFGYVFTCFLWLWATILYFGAIQSAVQFINTSTNQPATSEPYFELAIPTPIATVAIVIITVIMVAITIYALIILPKNAVKISSNAVQKTAKKAAVFTIKMQHKQDTKQNRAALTPKIIIIIKVAAILLPLVATFASGLLDSSPLDYTVAIIISGVIAIVSTVFFLAQYGLAALLHVTLNDLR